MGVKSIYKEPSQLGLYCIFGDKTLAVAVITLRGLLLIGLCLIQSRACIVYLLFIVCLLSVRYMSDKSLSSMKVDEGGTY